jgi:carbonic anhydrase/acetyltransferase-like protein (isoleucine patch superfamily)
MRKTSGLAGVLIPIALAGALAPAAAGAASGPAARAAQAEPASPCPFPLTRQNRPVAPRGAPPEVATFTDPTAVVEGAEDVRVAEKDYIAPFSVLRADDARICIEEGSNAQDNTLLDADDASIRLGRHAIMAHGSSVVADDRPATIAHRSACDPRTGHLPAPGPDPNLMERQPGESAGDFAERRGRQALSNALAGAHAHYDCDDVPAFISFNGRNESHISDGALVGATSRLASGVILRPGYTSYPGKSLNTQAQADTPGPPETHKVRLVNSGDIVFMEGVLHVNECLAEGYSEMYYTDPSSVRGVNRDPGTHHECTFNNSTEPPTFAGAPTIDPSPPQHVRIIGDAHFNDSYGTVMRNISDFTAIRADEGEPFQFGFGVKWGSHVSMHALEHTVEDPEVGVDLGNNVTVGERAVIHGGGRRARTGGPDPTPTHILDRSVVSPYAVVFRSFVDPDTFIGRKAILVGYDTLTPGERIPDRCVKFTETPRNACAYYVEW